ncbi:MULTISPECIES: glycosyltransferase family 4 protein [Halomonadaceae]|uniref:Glycosyltransferase n=1 Tax=Vreelandella halophila TaxID=86177 RepID=A0A9X4YBS4_9GAMM|nr:MULTISPECIES: glycosyltransferase family 4 protein [Halomonas]MYL26826.1 glycosyltransferase [Halomonas utahensis]MYL74087.1 glycosyltransferase [Halomonas sp. 22501_18_FS]
MGSDETPRVLVVGYSPRMNGGVVKVTETLRQAYPGMDLHVFHHCYRPKSRAVRTYLQSLLSFLFGLYRIRKSYDVVHVIVGSSGDAVRTLPYIWFSKLAGLPLCIQHHKSSDVVRAYLPRFFPVALIVLTWRSVEAHVFLSEKLRTDFETVFCAHDALFVIPNAIDETWIRSDSPGSLHDRTGDVVFFGRWSWEKGVGDMVRAAEDLADIARFECYTNTLNPTVEGQCQLYPWLGEREVQSILRSAKLLILPSYSEAFPTVLLEACACGTPFVASDVAGIPDIARNSRAGVTFPVGDVAAMVDAVRAILGDAEGWQVMADNGKAWAAEALRPEAIRTEWERLYRKIAP